MALSDTTNLQTPQYQRYVSSFFGSFSLQYRMKSQYCLRYIRDLRAFQRSQRCQYLVKEEELALFVRAVEELACLQANNAFYVECTSQLVECVDVFFPTNDPAFFTHYDYDADDTLPFNVARRACLPGVYETVFRIGVNYSADMYQKELRVSEGIGACLVVLCKRRQQEMEMRQVLQTQQIEQQLQRMQRTHILDTQQYEAWNAQEIVQWICGLQNGAYAKYGDLLQVGFEKIGVNGALMHLIDKTELKDMGVLHILDRTVIYREIQNLNRTVIYTRNMPRNMTRNMPRIQDC